MNRYKYAILFSFFRVWPLLSGIVADTTVLWFHLHTGVEQIRCLKSDSTPQDSTAASSLLENSCNSCSLRSMVPSCRIFCDPAGSNPFETSTWLLVLVSGVMGVMATMKKGAVEVGKGTFMTRDRRRLCRC